MFKDNLITYRKKKEMSQETLAKKINVVRQTVSKWEKGTSVPDVEMLQKVADALEISVNELLGEKNEIDVKDLAKTLKIINEQLEIKNNRTKLVWKCLCVIFSMIMVTSVSLAFAYKEIKKRTDYKNIIQLINNDTEITGEGMILDIKTVHFAGDECVAVINYSNQWWDEVCIFNMMIMRLYKRYILMHGLMI